MLGVLERDGGGLEGDHLLALDLEHRRELRRAVQRLQRDDDGHVLHKGVYPLILRDTSGSWG